MGHFTFSFATTEDTWCPLHVGGCPLPLLCVSDMSTDVGGCSHVEAVLLPLDISVDRIHENLGWISKLCHKCSFSLNC